MDNVTRKGSAPRAGLAPQPYTAHRTTTLAGLALLLIFCGDPSNNNSLPIDGAPQAVFTAICVDLSCTFTDGSTDRDGTISSRSWSYGDGSPAGTAASHTYTAAGTYTVGLTVTDNAGANGTITHPVTVSPANVSPTAAFTSSCTNLSCTFTDGSTDRDGTISSRSWSYGDGSPAGTAASHTYTAAGTYTVGLTVTDNAGATGTITHPVTVAASPSSDMIFIGAGDIADCTSANDEATAARIANYPTATVYTLGDNAYPDGTSTDYSQCYEPSWGKFKARTRPAPGNHDYHTSGASAYFAYFGSSAGPAGRGYYSYDLGSWHIISLNSEIDASATSVQATWLKQDLADHPAACTLAYWHKPLFTSGANHAPELAMRPLFTILYDAGADVVLSGHNHQYERFAPQRQDGTLDEIRGIREFVAGSGGAGLYDFTTAQPNSQVRYMGHGVLKLTLKATSYAWEFVPITGTSFTDAGTGACH